MATNRRSRVRIARKMLRAERAKLAHLSRDAQVTYVVGILVCDEFGHVSRTKLADSMRDSCLVSCAERIVSEVL